MTLKIIDTKREIKAETRLVKFSNRKIAKHNKKTEIKVKIVFNITEMEIFLNILKLLT